jgi:hypothetical protein
MDCLRDLCSPFILASNQWRAEGPMKHESDLSYPGRSRERIRSSFARAIVVVVISLHLSTVAVAVSTDQSEPACRGTEEFSQNKELSKTLLTRGKWTEALRISEMTKARALVENIARRAETVDVPVGVQSHDRDLSDRLVALQKAKQGAYEKGDRETAQACESQLAQGRARHDAFVGMLREKHPVYAAAKYPFPLDLAHAALNENEYILAYDVTDSGLLVFLIKGRQVIKALLKPVSKKDLQSMVQKFTDSMSIQGHNIRESLSRFDFRSGKELADVLLGDVLADIPKSAAVIIVPDDTLCWLPFEALPLNEGGRAQRDQEIPQIAGAEFFADRNDISYCQSVTLLSVSRVLRGQRPMGNRVLVVVDPVFSPEDERARESHKRKRQKQLEALPDLELMSFSPATRVVFSRLPLTGQLGEALKALEPTKTDVYSAMEASKQTLLRKDLTPYRAIVIATHQYFGSDLPGMKEPVMVLTLVDQPEGQDGFLRMSEVMGLEFNADIVALASGSGAFVPGEGVMSMARAFQYAGAKSVLMSLGAMTEHGSVQLLESFFKAMNDGKSKLEALRQARNELRNAGYDHPFFWATCVLAGDVN